MRIITALAVTALLLTGLPPAQAAATEPVLGSISGHVTYRSDAVNALISLYRLDIPTKTYLLEATGRIGYERGDYRVGNLPRGRYILKFTDASDHPIFSDLYWKNSRTMRGGKMQAVNIKGQDLTGFDVEMRRRP